MAAGMASAIGEILLGAVGWILLLGGYVCTLGLLYVPFARLKALWVAQHGVDHLPLMYLLSLLNSIAWVAYGWLPPHKYSVLIISVVGTVAQLVYITWYIHICAHPVGKFITVFVLVILLLSCGALAGVMFFLHRGLFGGDPNSLDTLATFTAALTYVGPLADTIVAICTGDPTRMSVPIILVSLGNAVCWGEYGRVTGQLIIRTANEYGIISPLVQLVVYLMLRWEELHQIIHEEIPQFYAQMTQFISRYILLQGDENEEDNA